MKDVLIPVGLLVVIGVIAFAIITGARKQRKLKRDVFRDFAESEKLRYEATDDGKAQRFARDLDGIGQFKSPSLGDVIPQDVVSGNLDGMDVTLFRHQTRFYEGYAQEWFVAGLSAGADIAERCSIQFLTGRASKDSMYLKDPIIMEKDVGSFSLILRSPNRVSTGQLLNERILKQVASHADGLPFRPEIQVRGNRLAVYPAGRNAEIDSVEGISRLLEYGKILITTLT